MSKPILETKKFVEHWNGKIDENDVFYRYNIDGNLVWFSQKQDSGNIYIVSIRLNEDLNEHFDVWVHCEDNRLFYPDDITIEIKHSHIKQNDIDKVVYDIDYLNRLCYQIMSIFKTEEHYELWFDNHKR